MFSTLFLVLLCSECHFFVYSAKMTINQKEPMLGPRFDFMNFDVKQRSKRSEEENILHRNVREIGNGASSSTSAQCHSYHLHRCGAAIVQIIASDHSKSSCEIREDFLDCMVRERTNGCSMPSSLSYTAYQTNQIRNQIKTLMIPVRGCILKV